ncbi:MAG: 4-hydroxy-tetrahydrodipicolinate reductase [Brumimicrobium sp.]
MRIALVGYGKMGKAIEKIALERGHKIVAKISSNNPLDSFDTANFDVAIDFSTPSTVLSNINYLVERKVPTVIGTTGWNNSLPEVTEKVTKQNTVLLHASNFSVGVNLFFKLNEELAKLMQEHGEYRVGMEEIHHTEKLDAPSGTAITLAEDIIKNHALYKDWNCPQSEKKEKKANFINIEAIREPEVKGTHTIFYKSAIDTITISHEAHNREGFALGAVLAAEWIEGKKGVFTMKDVLNIKP